MRTVDQPPAVEAEDEQPSAVIPQLSEINWSGVARWLQALLGLTAVVAIVWIAFDLHSTLDAAPGDTSAVQLIQIYTASLYRLIVVLALLIAGYVLSRSME